MNRENIKNLAAKLMTERTKLSYGQAIWNVALSLDPTIADFKDSEFDCYNDNNKIEIFLDRVCGKE